jgi:hypothetical protein
MHKKLFTLALLLLLVHSWGFAQIVRFRLDGERLSLEAYNTPLKELLTQFTYCGVAVRLDPFIEATVNVAVRDTEIETVFEELLAPYGYVLIWDVIAGPVGTLPRLAEIQVFRQGHEEEMVPIFDANANLEVTRGPDGNGPLYVADEVLLGVRGGTTLAEFRLLLNQVGGTVIESIPELGIYRVRFMPGTNVEALVAQLGKNAVIHTVEPHYVFEMPKPTTTTSTLPQPVDTTYPEPPEGAVPVAVLDSGLHRIPGLKDVVTGTLDAMNPEREISDPVGHGTQMAMISAGAIQPAGGAGGTEATPVVAIRAFDDNGRASNFGIMRSFTYALNEGARVVNMSWGSETSSKFLANAVAYAQSEGLVLVAAAGNEPTGTPFYPAAYPGVVAVAATDENGASWEQSNFGNFVTLAAPGTASFPVGHEGPPGAYAGTSIASAYAARALALYLSAHPAAEPAEAVAALQASLSDAGEEGRDAQYGYGVLDQAAWERLLNTP